MNILNQARIAGRSVGVISAGSALIIAASSAAGAPTTFLGRAAFLAHAQANGWSTEHEGFESDAVWGAVRSSATMGFHTAPSVTNLGCEWRSPNPNGGVTTSEGAARSGQWGFFAYPHFVLGISDGWVLRFDPPVKAVGGYVRTNTPPAELGVFVNGSPTALDFGENQTVLDGVYRFFGVADPDGISMIEFRDVEAGGDDYHNLFTDDFDFARAPSCPGDLNGDGAVNFGDLNILLGNFNQSGAGLPGDLDGDEDVDFADLNLLLADFGAICA